MKKEGDSAGKKPKQMEGYGTGEISIQKLVFYNLIFFIPIIAFLFASVYLGKFIAGYLETTPAVAASIIMLFFGVAFFFVIIPFIRARENVRGVRYALFGFLIVAIGMTIPSMTVGRFGMFLMQLPHIATYILLTFIYTPEVLGMDIDISKWFKHYKQLLIIFIYTSIVLGYVLGFGYMFYTMHISNPESFSFSYDKAPGYPTFIYYSAISFTTIGYGDITPVIGAARLLVVVEALIGAIVNVIFIAILFVYISNFQAFLKEMEKEEKEIKKLERIEKGILDSQKNSGAKPKSKRKRK